MRFSNCKIEFVKHVYRTVRLFKLKEKVQFPNEESLDKAIYILVLEYNNQFSNRTHLGFGLVRYELKMMIEEISDSPTTIKSTI